MFDELQKRIGYQFKNVDLLKTALTHSSYVKGDGIESEFNERLEFLGDAVIELAVSVYLYECGKHFNEGQMSKSRAAIVCEKSLFEAAKSIGLNEYLLLSRGEEKSGGRQKPSLVSDAFEALVGAIFLDGGREQADLFIKRCLLTDNLENELILVEKDYKSRLQELIQSKHQGNIHYSLIEEKGPDHNKQFTIAVFLDGNELGRGTGRSKQDAGQEAAKKALESLIV